MSEDIKYPDWKFDTKYEVLKCPWYRRGWLGKILYWRQNRRIARVRMEIKPPIIIYCLEENSLTKET